jgi:hypothetical protein
MMLRQKTQGTSGEARPAGAAQAVPSFLSAADPFLSNSEPIAPAVCRNPRPRPFPVRDDLCYPCEVKAVQVEVG